MSSSGDPAEKLRQAHIIFEHDGCPDHSHKDVEKNEWTSLIELGGHSGCTTRILLGRLILMRWSRYSASCMLFRSDILRHESKYLVGWNSKFSLVCRDSQKKRPPKGLRKSSTLWTGESSFQLLKSLGHRIFDHFSERKWHMCVQIDQNL